jgi:hypothetical protein
MSVPVTAASAEATIEPAAGVAVTLTSATLTLSDLRLETPATARWTPRVPGVSAALAHPGHDFAGSVAGELTGTWTLDLLADSTRLGDASCYEGDYATARLTLLPDPAAAFTGTVSVAGVDRAFRLDLTPDQAITGILFEATLSAEAPPAGLTLSFDLAHALSFVDWSTPDADGDGVLTTADGPVANTALFGLVATPTYTLYLEQ